MRKLFTAAAVVGSLSLANCGGGANLPSINTALSTAEAYVIGGVNSLCQFQVAADTVLAVLAQASAEAAIGLICNAVKPTTQAARFGARVPVVHVNGKTIVVHGHF